MTPRRSPLRRADLALLVPATLATVAARTTRVQADHRLPPPATLPRADAPLDSGAPPVVPSP